MLPDIQPGNTKILYFFNCLLDGMHTTLAGEGNSIYCGRDLGNLQKVLAFCGVVF